MNRDRTDNPDTTPDALADVPPDDESSSAAAAWDAVEAGEDVAPATPPAPVRLSLADRALAEQEAKVRNGGGVAVPVRPFYRGSDRGAWADAGGPAVEGEYPGTAWLRQYLALRNEAHAIIRRLQAVPLGSLLDNTHDDDLCRLAAIRPTHEVRGDVEPYQRPMRDLENRLGSTINPLAVGSGLVRDALGYAVPAAMVEVPR